ncbi:MAG: YerC/YecD family TrpR-related protein [Acutalibacteraceae bacterium]|nr:YerC/YecD family TrpR-related protein [Acutalibacteraceae bacterium]
MRNSKVNGEMLADLFGVISSIKDEKECEALLRDMCTDKEIEKMAQRIAAARLLLEGKTYNQIIEATDISSATLSRVSRALQYGKGYKKILK